MEMIPSEITQGDSLNWTESESDYPASDGWVIGYNLVMATRRINFESTADGDNHSFDLTTTTTKLWYPGDYSWQRYVYDSTQRITLTHGNVEIKRNFLTPGDERSHAQKTLDSILAVLENRATLDQEEYSISGRSLKRMSISDLLSFRDIYQAEVTREINAERIKNGLGTKQTIRVRF